MRKILMFACCLATMAFVACNDKNNDNTDPNNPDGDVVITPNDAIEAFNKKYDLDAILNVDTATFRYAAADGEMYRYWRNRPAENGDTIDDFLGQYFVEADNDYVPKVLKFIEEEVFSVFGEQFIKGNMPRKIYFASEMQYNPDYFNKDIAYAGFAKDIYHTFDGGTCCPEYIMFSHCCSDFDTMDKEYLKGLYASLIIEYIFSQKEVKFDEPTAFNQYSYNYTQGYSFYCTNKNSQGYYESASEDYEQGWTYDRVYYNSFDDVDNKEGLWRIPIIWYQTELRPGRVGATEMTIISDKNLDKYPEDYPTKYAVNFYRASNGQVLGDYVAFIITTTAAEKEEYYAEIEAAIAKANTPEGAPFYSSDDYFGGEAVALENILRDIKARVELCKEYFAELGIILTDKQ